MLRLFILLLFPVLLKSQPVHIISYELDYNFAFDTSDSKVILRLKGDLNVSARWTFCFLPGAG